MKSVILILLLMCGLLDAHDGVKLLKLTTTAEIERADLYVWRPEGDIVAVMIFCPGHNGSGGGFVNDPEWQRFAEENHFALCGLSFASPMALTQKGFGYSHVDRESGKILLDAVDKEFDGKQLPLVFYGYSAGARFSTSFLAWKPDRVIAWCASGVGNWPALPNSGKIAPGIVACGEFDAGCYWSSLHYFQSGRQRNYPWVWVSLKDLGHEQSKELDKFTREYFKVILSNGLKPFEAEYYDIATRRQIQSQDLEGLKIFSASIPEDKTLIKNWLEIHYP